MTKRRDEGIQVLGGTTKSGLRNDAQELGGAQRAPLSALDNL